MRLLFKQFTERLRMLKPQFISNLTYRKTRSAQAFLCRVNNFILNVLLRVLLGMDTQ